MSTKIKQDDLFIQSHIYIPNAESIPYHRLHVMYVTSRHSVSLRQCSLSKMMMTLGSI